MLTTPVDRAVEKGGIKQQAKPMQNVTYPDMANGPTRRKGRKKRGVENRQKTKVFNMFVRKCFFGSKINMRI
jgi:hypothetical protein